MAQLKKIIGSPVLSSSTSCIIGKIADVYFDEKLKNSVYFCIRHAESDEAFLLPFGLAQSISDAVVIDSEASLVTISDADVTALRFGVLGMPVFTPVGADKGEISDVTVAISGKVLKLQTPIAEFTPSQIVSVGNAIVQKGGVKPKQKKPSLPRPEKDYPVYILNDREKVLEIEKSIRDGVAPMTLNENNAETLNKVATESEPATETPAMEAIPVANATDRTPAVGATDKEPVLSNGAFEILLDGSDAYSYDEDAHTPTRVICDYEFLLGRTLGADLNTYTGELIARKNSVVTDAVVERARRAGKLVELTLNSVKP